MESQHVAIYTFNGVKHSAVRTTSSSVRNPFSVILSLIINSIKANGERKSLLKTCQYHNVASQTIQIFTNISALNCMIYYNSTQASNQHLCSHTQTHTNTNTSTRSIWKKVRNTNAADHSIHDQSFIFLDAIQYFSHHI